jgi:hypothetical protein
MTPDGSHVLFSTGQQLESADTDNGQVDVYDRSGGATELVSTGPNDTQGFSACTSITTPPTCPVRVSNDGSHVFFITQEPLVPGDTGFLDVYERSGATTTLVSTGPNGGDGPLNVIRGSLLVSTDGSHAFFATRESLVSEDTDTHIDVYERTGGTTELVSTGPVETDDSPNATLDAISPDGSRAIFDSASRLSEPTDDGGYADVFERHAGQTTLLSTGPADNGFAGGRFVAANPGATHVVFDTRHSMVSSDNDYCMQINFGCSDIYERLPGFETPQTASPIHVSLVPVFRECDTGANPANGQHSPPLGTLACLPPQENPGQAAHLGPGSSSAADLTVVPGDGNGGNGDQADVTIAASLNDVQDAAGADYAPNPSGPDVTLSYRLRQSDFSGCGPPSCTGPYTSAASAGDYDLTAPLECTATGGPEGSDCAANTSADAILPGLVNEGRRAVAQVFRVRLVDSGQNNSLGDSDDRIFATQGVYVP